MPQNGEAKRKAKSENKEEAHGTLHGVPPQPAHEKVSGFFKLPKFGFLKSVRCEIKSSSAENFHH